MTRGGKALRCGGLSFLLAFLMLAFFQLAQTQPTGLQAKKLRKLAQPQGFGQARGSNVVPNRFLVQLRPRAEAAISGRNGKLKRKDKRPKQLVSKMRSAKLTVQLARQFASGAWDGFTLQTADSSLESVLDMLDDSIDVLSIFPVVGVLLVHTCAWEGARGRTSGGHAEAHCVHVQFSHERHPPGRAQQPHAMLGGSLERRAAAAERLLISTYGDPQVPACPAPAGVSARTQRLVVTGGHGLPARRLPRFRLVPGHKLHVLAPRSSRLQAHGRVWDQGAHVGCAAIRGFATQIRRDSGVLPCVLGRCSLP